jgi:hypothetical protein
MYANKLNSKVLNLEACIVHVQESYPILCDPVYGICMQE